MVKGKHSKHDALDRYIVEFVPLDEITPSPENDDLYGPIRHDEQMECLIASIESIGLTDPIHLTQDDFILSGHRRFFALSHLGFKEVPCFRRSISRAGNPEFHAVLAEYNPQRVKSVGSLLKEALLRDRSADDTYAALEQYRDAQRSVDVDFMEVPGIKDVKEITAKKKPFLAAVKKVVDNLHDYWPLSIRQIHYNLLNDPPLTSSPKRSKFPRDHYRYRNNDDSYNALVRLLTPARYHGHIPMAAIDDPTRPVIEHGGWNDVDSFVRCEIDGFLDGFHRDRQVGQPRHIEVLGEKNTLMTILNKAVNEYYVPLSLGRGFCSVPVWAKMAKRFRQSGKDAMTLIIVSDYDPEGLSLADDGIRSLRDLWGVPVEGHRVAVTREQVDELDLANDFNPAKVSSSRFKSFVERTGGEATWECEALPPKFLIEEVKGAIEANMDMELFEKVVEQERADCDELFDVKQSIAQELQF